ncbi:MFS transporter [Lachnoclostridium phytofermentans]|uniref:Major facilitator superfamily MFS_1 n=1 Tax=Lachnoclostridium phytofermentans (strain ATCC 700394 / DSM 18823 / ISDg) TaxID=357809 RepID=A9KRE9_LACP7|nr:MFS transporter [Lachnoclostridium phytofermentans]ABX42023.1 major facilitator superfamily MFS_1 [Lachnoclostridium phytofermentans ISDg]
MSLLKSTRQEARLGYHHTLYASYLGYITQAIINNFPALLFLTFQKEFDISLERIATMVSINFIIQIIVDFIGAKTIDKIGYRISAIVSHGFCVIGLISLGTLPKLLPNPYLGLLIAVALNAIGGGIIEVIISPIVESLPGKEKDKAMSLLHSFYCFGHVGVVILSTLFFLLIGIEHWPFLAYFWMLIPLGNLILFLKVPLCTLSEHQEEATTYSEAVTQGEDKNGKKSLKSILTSSLFAWLFLLMICSGAAEQAMSQWASYFAEAGLKVSKTFGDLLGPCAFAMLMGISRALYGKKGERIKLERAMALSSALCILSYLTVIFSPLPILSLIACAICGFSVGIMWPGTFSLAAKNYRQGGTAMFAILALAGDVGCALGPAIVGFIANRTTYGLRAGMLPVLIFPVIMIVGVYIIQTKKKAKYS